MPRKKKIPVEVLETSVIPEPPKDPHEFEVECEAHGWTARVNMQYKGEPVARYCFLCYSFLPEKLGIKNYIPKQIPEEK